MPKIVFLSSAGSFSGQIDSLDVMFTPSISGGIVQYNIYRSLVTGGPYTLIGNSPPYNNGAALVYTDFAVLHNTTYFYVVTAFDGTNESIFSAEGSATTRP